MEDLRRFRPQTAEDREIMKRIDAWEDQAKQLRAKARSVPENMGAFVDSIAMSTFEMLKNMREDPADRRPGEKFLNRYLPAANKIVDEYVRLAGEHVTQDNVAESLARAVQVLERLDKAFQEEHSAMLRNDSVNFTAELNALDALLKMGGH